jgi:hypothetical protein
VEKVAIPPPSPPPNPRRNVVFSIFFQNFPKGRICKKMFLVIMISLLLFEFLRNFAPKKKGERLSLTLLNLCIESCPLH